MAFLSPFFLWLLPLVSVPTLIHLWHKYRVKEVEFSTISFLKIMESKSIKKVKLIEIILLILRTLIILLLVLFISRPIIKGQFSNWISNPQSTLTAIIIDDSFSMNGNRFEKNNINLIKNKVNEIKNSLIEKQFVLFGTFNNGIQFFGLREEFEEFEPAYEITDLNIGIDKIWSQINDSLNQEIINKELYLITDLQENSFKIKDENKILELKNWNTFILDFDLPVENLAIKSLQIKSEIVLPNEPFEIIVQVINNGRSPQFQRLISLNVDGLDVGQELISLEPNDEKEVLFKTALPQTGNFKISAKLDQDDLLKDNEYIRVVSIPKHIRIGLYSVYPEDMIYLNHTLSAINQNNNIFSVSDYPLNQLGTANLKQYDVLFISGIIDKNTWNRIKNFCKTGKKAIIFPSSKENKYFDNNFKEINPIDLINEDYILTHQDVINNISDVALEKLLINKFTPPKFFKYYNLNNSQNKLIQLENNITIWDRIKIEKGYIDKLGIGFTTDWSNLPITAGFIPFLHNWIYSGNTTSSKINYVTGNELNVRGENSLGKYELSTPFNKNYLLPVNQNGILYSYTFKNSGWYNLILNDIIIDIFDVNISQVELNIQKLEKEKIDLIFPNHKIISPIKEFGEEVKSAKIGTEIGNQLLLLIIFLLIIEMFIAHFKSNQGKNN